MTIGPDSGQLCLASLKVNYEPMAVLLLVHQVRDWFSGAAANFGWMREAKRENTRCGLRPMSDKAASQKTRSAAKPVTDLMH